MSLYLTARLILVFSDVPVLQINAGRYIRCSGMAPIYTTYIEQQNDSQLTSWLQDNIYITSSPSHGS
jgi:hypothetical protein